MFGFVLINLVVLNLGFGQVNCILFSDKSYFGQCQFIVQSDRDYPGQLPLVLTKNKSVTLFSVWRLKLLKLPMRTRKS